MKMDCRGGKWMELAEHQMECHVLVLTVLNLYTLCLFVCSFASQSVTGNGFISDVPISLYLFIQCFDFSGPEIQCVHFPCHKL
jgi:hypothetical protein